MHLYCVTAIWSIDVESDGRYRVMYLPCEQGSEPFSCGTQSACTAASLILDWVICEAKPGDLVRVRPRGVTLLVQQPADA